MVVVLVRVRRCSGRRHFGHSVRPPPGPPGPGSVPIRSVGASRSLDTELGSEQLEEGAGITALPFQVGRHVDRAIATTLCEPGR